MNNVIPPSIGRVLWFYQGGSSQFKSTQQPFAAMVAYVHSDRCVNIGYLGATGTHNHATSVPLLQGDDAPPLGQFCMWMPYQKDQAAKAEATTHGSHASKVLYPAIKRAMQELEELQPGFNFAVDRAYNHLHRAFWSECPRPASAPGERPEAPSTTL